MEMTNDRQSAYVARLKQDGFVQVSGWVKAEHAHTIRRWMRIAGGREQGEMPSVRVPRDWVILIFDQPPPRADREALKTFGMRVLDGPRNLWMGKPAAGPYEQIMRIAALQRGRIICLQ
jgi:hypothetical protein